jgi:thiamine pyrophosphate-dependent acetolactate synthase large subunit-like protein
VICPSEDEIEQLAELLNRAETVTILGGAGCVGAHAELIETAGKLKSSDGPRASPRTAKISQKLKPK